MEQKIVCLVLVLVGLTTVWGQLDFPCSLTCGTEGGITSGSSSNAPSPADIQPGNNNNNNQKLCCPAGFTRTLASGKCTCSIPLPSFAGPNGKPNLSDMTPAQLTQLQFELMGYIRRLTSVVPIPQEKLTQSQPKFIL